MYERVQSEYAGSGSDTLCKMEANIVNYVVEHYQQNVQGDGYTLKESSHARAAVDSEVTPEVMKYKGFEEPKTEKVTISGDGQTTVKYYYKRKGTYSHI